MGACCNKEIVNNEGNQSSRKNTIQVEDLKNSEIFEKNKNQEIRVKNSIKNEFNDNLQIEDNDIENENNLTSSEDSSENISNKNSSQSLHSVTSNNSSSNNFTKSSKIENTSQNISNTSRNVKIDNSSQNNLQMSPEFFNDENHLSNRNQNKNLEYDNTLINQILPPSIGVSMKRKQGCTDLLKYSENTPTNPAENGGRPSLNINSELNSTNNETKTNTSSILLEENSMIGGKELLKMQLNVEQVTFILNILTEIDYVNDEMDQEIL
jgi:hypothetical protein